MLVLQNILASIQLPSTAKEQLNPDAFSSGKQMSFITVKAVLPPGMKSRKVHYCFFKPSSRTCRALARHQRDCSLFKCRQSAQCWMRCTRSHEPCPKERVTPGQSCKALLVPGSHTAPICKSITGCQAVWDQAHECKSLWEEERSVLSISRSQLILSAT